MDNSAYEIVGNTNQPPSIELDTIYEKVDLEKPEDTCTKLVAQQDVQTANLKSNCKLNVVKAGYSTFLEIHICVTVSLVSNHEIPCNFRGM